MDMKPNNPRPVHRLDSSRAIAKEVSLLQEEIHKAPMKITTISKPPNRPEHCELKIGECYSDN